MEVEDEDAEDDADTADNDASRDAGRRSEGTVLGFPWAIAASPSEAAVAESLFEAAASEEAAEEEEKEEDGAAREAAGVERRGMPSLTFCAAETLKMKSSGASKTRTMVEPSSK